jgi:hypothetical protein
MSMLARANVVVVSKIEASLTYNEDNSPDTE